MSIKRQEHATKNSPIFVNLNEIQQSKRFQQASLSYKNFRFNAHQNNNANYNDTITPPLMSINLTASSKLITDNLMPINLNNSSEINHKTYNPKVNIFANQRNYTGPYSVNCIMNARRFLIERLNPNNTIFNFDKISKDELEILKLKLNIPCISDENENKLKLMKQLTNQNRKLIKQRHEYVDSKVEELKSIRCLNTSLISPISSNHSVNSKEILNKVESQSPNEDIKNDRISIVIDSANDIGLYTACDGQHPVSYLQMICVNKKWPMPVYEEVDEFGPSHARNFLMKVILNDQSFQPPTHSQNKKLAKAYAALCCLKNLGYFNK